MIDKEGKLFGKINIIDLLIILVVVAALIFVAIKVIGHDSNAGEAQGSKVRIGFYAAQVEEGFDENVFYEGAPLYEDLTNVSLGKLTDWNVEPEYEYQVNSEGETVKLEHTNNHFVNITAEVEGTMAPDGLHIGSSLYCVGAHYTIHVGTGKLYVECCELTPLD